MDASSAITLFGGLGFFLLGVHHLTEGLKGLAGDWLRRALQTIVAGRFSAIAFGAVFTALIQSSSATVLTVIGFISAGLVTFSQAVAVLIGATLGTTTTPWMVAFFGFRMQISAAAMPILGVGAFLWLVTKGGVRSLGAILAGFGLIFIGIEYLQTGPLARTAVWAVSRLDDYDGVLGLAAFGSIFKLMGVLFFYPWLDAYSRFIVRISGKGSDTAVSRLEPALAEAGGAVALEAAWRALLEVAHGSVETVRRRLAGETLQYERPVEAVQQINHFLESLSLETTDLAAMRPVPPAVDGWEPPAGFDAGAQALSAWLSASKDPSATPAPPVFDELEAASKQLTVERKDNRATILENIALQRMPIATAWKALDALSWGDGALHHCWRMIEALRIASGDHTWHAAVTVGSAPVKADRESAA
jgi:phosphate:Na+ symporter